MVGIGYAHASDRLIQMLLQRTISLGRLSQDLAATPETIAIDKIFKEQNFIGNDLTSRFNKPRARVKIF